ncbi:MAG: hypothetical protein R3F19_26845 [Verrucomicrobiales bacterium]
MKSPSAPLFLFAFLVSLHLPGHSSLHGETVALAGLNVVPHVQSPNMRYRRAPDPEMGARVEIFLKNSSEVPWQLTSDLEYRFDEERPSQLLESGEWAWHETPSARDGLPCGVPPGALTVWSFNSRGSKWAAGSSHRLTLGTGPETTSVDLDLTAANAWLSAVTFDSSSDSIHPDKVFVHLANHTGADISIRRCRLWLPAEGADFLALLPQPWLNALDLFPQNGIVTKGDKGGFVAKTDPLPLTYTAIEVECARADETSFSLWAYLRIKREVFDLSGGWVASDIDGKNTLTMLPYLKTLKRMHINTGQIEEVGGYTDNAELYAQYPIKRFNRLANFQRYDADAMLSQIHAVEFLGEPQYGGGRPVPPQEVWKAFEPYQKTRLATTVTHSEERVWRYYAGLSDYPHYDAYRVTAPAADSWRSYDRWGGASISWGAPLETIGDMTRSLRDLNRPRPIAYWAQGAHDGWRTRSRERASPTPDELAAQAYHGLANRITSIYWFNLSLKSLVKFPDLIDPITRVNRVSLTIAPLVIEGDAYEYKRLLNEGKLDWDLSSITGKEGALFFANDLAYSPDNDTNTFEFTPRQAALTFRLPGYLSKPEEVFRVDADGVHEVEFTLAPDALQINDRIDVAAVYVAAANPGLRQRLAQKHAELIKEESAYAFDPASKASDLDSLRALLKP